MGDPGTLLSPRGSMGVGPIRAIHIWQWKAEVLPRLDGSNYCYQVRESTLLTPVSILARSWKEKNKSIYIHTRLIKWSCYSNRAYIYIYIWDLLVLKIILEAFNSMASQVVNHIHLIRSQTIKYYWLGMEQKKLFERLWTSTERK